MADDSWKCVWCGGDEPATEQPEETVTYTGAGGGKRANVGKVDYTALDLRVVAKCVEDELLSEVGTWLGEFQMKHADQSERTSMLWEAMDHLLDEHPEVLRESAEVLALGEKKYGRYNWMKGMPWSVVLACAMRHLIAADEKGVGALDAESGKSHVAHLATNIMFLLSYVSRGVGLDDLPGTVLAPPGSTTKDTYVSESDPEDQ